MFKYVLLFTLATAVFSATPLAYEVAPTVEETQVNSAVDIQVCPGGPTSLVDIEKLEVIGQIKAGSTIQIHFVGTNKVNVDITKFHAKIYFGAIKFLDEDVKYEYDFKVGHVDKSVSLTVPKIVLKGKYHGTVILEDKNSKKWECFQFTGQSD